MQRMTLAVHAAPQCLKMSLQSKMMDIKLNLAQTTRFSQIFFVLKCAVNAKAHILLLQNNPHILACTDSDSHDASGYS